MSELSGNMLSIILCSSMILPSFLSCYKSREYYLVYVTPYTQPYSFIKNFEILKVPKTIGPLLLFWCCFVVVLLLFCYCSVVALVFLARGLCAVYVYSVILFMRYLGRGFYAVYVYSVILFMRYIHPT